MNKIAFGRYTPYNSFTHKLDSRNKLFLTIAFIVIVFFQFSNPYTTLILSGVYLLLLIIIMLISRVSFFELFKSLLGMWFFVLFIFAVYIFIPNKAYEGGMVAFKINNYPIYWEAIYQSGYILLRIILMIALMMVLTSTTTPMDLTYAFEWYMTPLKVVHFPVHEIAMTLSIALRFIPTILDETDRIMKAQSSRGVDFNKGGLFKRFKAIVSLIIPLFVSAIDRSEELANAMEARGYDPKAKRTRFKKLHFSWRDIIAFLLIIGLVAGIIVLFVYDHRIEGGLDLLKILFNVDGVDFRG